MDILDKITDHLHKAVGKMRYLITHKQSLSPSIIAALREAKEEIDKANDIIVYSDYPQYKITQDIEYANQDISFMLIDEFYNKTMALFEETKTVNDFFCKKLLDI